MRPFLPRAMISAPAGGRKTAQDVFISQTTFSFWFPLFWRSNKHKDDFFFKISGISNLPTPTVTEASPSLVSTKSPCMARAIFPTTETNAFDYPDSPIVRGSRFGDSVYKTFNNLWGEKNKGNEDAGCLFLASLDKLTKGRMSSVIVLTNV